MKKDYVQTCVTTLAWNLIETAADRQSHMLGHKLRSRASLGGEVASHHAIAQIKKKLQQQKREIVSQLRTALLQSPPMHTHTQTQTNCDVICTWAAQHRLLRPSHGPQSLHGLQTAAKRCDFPHVWWLVLSNRLKNSRQCGGRGRDSKYHRAVADDVVVSQPHIMSDMARAH